MSDRPPPAPALGFSGLLALLFIGLKLTGFVTWPWLWVLCPLWIPILLGMTLLAVASTILAYHGWSARRETRQRRRAAERTEAGLPQENQHGPVYRWGRRHDR